MVELLTILLITGLIVAVILPILIATAGDIGKLKD